MRQRRSSYPSETNEEHDHEIAGEQDDDTNEVIRNFTHVALSENITKL
jgi:hypothetical protein